MQPLPVFLDDRFPGPEPRVAAALLRTAIDLRELRLELSELGCPTAMWQGQVLVCGSSANLGQQQCSAVFLPDGCAIFWHMSKKTSARLLDVAARCSAPRRGPTRLGVPDMSLGPGTRASRSSEPLATEELDVVYADGESTELDPYDGVLRLTRDPKSRASHQLGLSLGLAVAARLDALEKRIEGQLEEDWQVMQAEADRSFNLSHLSHRIFMTEKGLHELRYELNSEAGLLDAPDLLWDHALAERLFDQVVAHFDVRRRRVQLNERLSYSLDYLHTLGENVKHQHSARLERIVILLIFLELCVGLHGLDTTAIKQFVYRIAGDAASVTGRFSELQAWNNQAHDRSDT